MWLDKAERRYSDSVPLAGGGGALQEILWYWVIVNDYFRTAIWTQSFQGCHNCPTCMMIKKEWGSHDQGSHFWTWMLKETLMSWWSPSCRLWASGSLLTTHASWEEIGSSCVSVKNRTRPSNILLNNYIRQMYWAGRLKMMLQCYRGRLGEWPGSKLSLSPLSFGSSFPALPT